VNGGEEGKIFSHVKLETNSHEETEEIQFFSKYSLRMVNS
jgi:hypothetical protein